MLAERSSDAYLRGGTIAAISSAVGEAIGVIRISGPEAILLLSRLTGRGEFKHRHMARARVLDVRGKPIDDTMVVAMRAPNTFTGEPMAEIYGHGGSTVLRLVLDRITELGAVPALPGEFAFRAVRNGKLTLDQAEGINDLIRARSGSAVRLAFGRLDSTLRRPVSALREDAIRLVALSELGIDFADQDVDQVSLRAPKDSARALNSRISNLEETFARAVRAKQGVRLSILGLPNAGKSALFNAILGFDRAIVSEHEGTTRDVLREELTLRGNDGDEVYFRLSDTAGIRSTSNPIEAEGIRRTGEAAGESDLWLWACDSTRPLESQDPERFTGLSSAPRLGVLTKVDLVNQAELKELKYRYQRHFGGEWISTSASTHEGIQDLTHAMVAAVRELLPQGDEEAWVQGIEQREALRAARVHLERAFNAPSEDLFAADLRQALRALDAVLGVAPTDEILGKIFSEFCIGK